MTIHDPEIEITCDNCTRSVYLPMTWSTGGYGLSESQATSLLSSDHDWLTDGDKHYCYMCRGTFRD